VIARARPVMALVAAVAACAPAVPPPVAPLPQLAPCAVAPGALASPPPAPAPLPPSTPDTPVEHALAQLFADAWETFLRESPVAASTLGERRYDDRWAEVSGPAFARRRAADTA